jgi:hypothetical protein
LDYLTTHTSLSPIGRWFAPSFVNYKKGCTRLAAASDKVYQLLAHGRCFLGTPSSSTTKTGHHDIAESENTINQSINQSKMNQNSKNFHIGKIHVCIYNFYFSSNIDVVSFFELIVLRTFSSMLNDFLYPLQFQRLH